MLRTARRLVPLVCAVAFGVASPASAAEPSVSHADAIRALQAARQAFATKLSGGGAAPREATPALRDLAIALPALRGVDRRAGRRLLARPTDPGGGLPGPEAPGSPRCDAHFCVHWTDAGPNAPSSPAFVDQVVDSLNLSFAVENGALGWQNARSDGSRGARHGIGNEGQIDVYIVNLDPGLYGYAAPDPGQRGSRRFAYLVLDNDYRGFPSPPLESLDVTVAHEYNHILQFNYDTYQDTWMFESSAVWMEQQVYPDINDYLNYLPALASPRRMPLTGGRTQIYAEAVWNHWLSSRYGLPVVRDAWSASQAGVKPQHFAIRAYDAAIKAHGGASFATEFGGFAAATAEWNSSSSFPDAASYPDVRRNGKLGRRPGRARLDNTTYRLLDVNVGGERPLTLKVKAPPRTQSSIALVARQGPLVGGTVTTQLRQLPKGGRGRMTLADPAAYDRITAVITNADARTRGFDRRSARNYTRDGASYRFRLAR